MATGSREAFRYFAFLAGALIVIAVALVGCSLYERSTSGEYRLGIGAAPHFTLYYQLRLAGIALLVLLVIAGLRRLRGAGALRHRVLSTSRQAIVYLLLAAAAGWTALFVVDPGHFRAIALEDGPIEWASALLPLASSAAFLWAFHGVLRSERRDAGRRVALVMTALFAAVLFIIGMEEISWMQRIFDVPTPALFQGNEQQETNLHNMYSSLLFNLIYRTGVFGGLIVLPFLAETAPKNALFEGIRDFLPDRFVLAASAPLAGFDYNTLNFFLGPLLLLTTLAILLVHAKAAWERADLEETRLFVMLALFVLASQAVFLASPANFSDTWVISEYRELLLAVGLAVFTGVVTARLRARYGSARRGTPSPSTGPIRTLGSA
jgi:hypothetical protein